MTLRYLLDTNVVSELMRVQPSSSVLAWLAQQPSISLYTSVITVAEVQAGLALMPPGQRQLNLQAATQAMFTQDFAGRVWSFDLLAAPHYALARAQRQRLGRPMSHADAQIAAIALAHQASVVTRNVADFEHVDGLTVINPWDA